MTYFHPWTFQQGGAQHPHVFHVSVVRGESAFGEEAPVKWLGGSVLSSQAVRYVSNVLCVVDRVRPRNETDDIRSDKDLDDDELRVDSDVV